MASPGPRNRSARVRTVATLVTGSLLVSACELPRFGAPDPAAEEGEHVQRLWSGFFVTAAAVTVLVWVLLAWVLIRYRRRPGDDEIPSQRAYNIPLEIFYTVVPILIVAALFFFSVRTENQVTGVERDPEVTVEVIGFQWGWQFHYPDEGFTVDAEAGELPELVLPVGVPSNLSLVADDVIHSFWVPDFLSKRDLIPGVDNTITVRPTRPGSYIGRCAEFCGLDHWRMAFTVRVVEPDAYDEWVADQRSSADATPPPAVDDDAGGPPTTVERER